MRKKKDTHEEVNVLSTEDLVKMMNIVSDERIMKPIGLSEEELNDMLMEYEEAKSNN